MPSSFKTLLPKLFTLLPKLFTAQLHMLSIHILNHSTLHLSSMYTIQLLIGQPPPTFPYQHITRATTMDNLPTEVVDSSFAFSCAALSQSLFLRSFAAQIQDLTTISIKFKRSSLLNITEEMVEMVIMEVTEMVVAKNRLAKLTLF